MTDDINNAPVKVNTSKPLRLIFLLIYTALKK